MTKKEKNALKKASKILLEVGECGCRTVKAEKFILFDYKKKCFVVKEEWKPYYSRKHSVKAKGRIIASDGKRWLFEYESIDFSTYGTYRTQGKLFFGFDDGQPFIIRMRKDIETIEEAERELMPKKVREAIEQGKTVVRQGDIFAVESKRNGKQRIGRHEIVAKDGKKKLIHPEHGEVLLDENKRWKLVQANVGRNILGD